MTRRGSMLSAVWLVWLTSCASTGSSGTETGNPLVKGNLSYTGYSSEPDDYGVLEGGAVGTVETAWLDLDTALVSTTGSCGLSAGDDFSVPALGVGDHAAGAHNFTAFEAQAGPFCRFSLPFVRVGQLPAGAPAALEGRSILIEGSLADGTPFSIASSLEISLELEAQADGFALSKSEPDLVVAFDFAAWLADVDFASATVTDGVLTIDADSNSDLLETIEANLASGIALYRDRDGDGAIDANPELLARAR